MWFTAMKIDFLIMVTEKYLKTKVVKPFNSPKNVDDPPARIL